MISKYLQIARSFSLLDWLKVISIIVFVGPLLYVLLFIILFSIRSALCTIQL